MDNNHQSFLKPKPDPKLFVEIDKVLDNVRELWLGARTTEDKRKWSKRLDELLDERNKIAKEGLLKLNEADANSI